MKAAAKRVKQRPRRRSRRVPGHRIIKPDIVRIPSPAQRPWELDQEQVRILKNGICKGATDNELEYCLTVARRYKLDPFKQQIWFVKRWDKSADNGQGGHGAFLWTPQVGIYGMAHIAARDHKDYGSFSRPEYGPMIQVEVEGKKIRAPEWCLVKAWKKGAGEPSIGEAYFEEYCPRRWENTLFWRSMPHRMIAKCAKAQAIREAYPETGGLYIPEECENVQGNYTREGRQIVYPGDRTLQPALDENAAHGWPAGSEQARRAEEQLRKVEAADRELAESRKASPKPSEPPASAQGKAQASSETKQHTQAQPKASREESQRATFPHSTQPSSPPENKVQGLGVGEEVVECIIQRVNSGMAGKYPIRQVCVLLSDRTKPTYTTFDKDLFEILDRGIGKTATLIIKRARNDYVNITAVLRIGDKEFLRDGTPVIAKDREPGSLFK